MCTEFKLDLSGQTKDYRILVFVELKSATDEKATLYKAYTQIQNYKKAVPSIFYYNARNIDDRRLPF
jgi:hypothetical protein